MRQLITLLVAILFLSCSNNGKKSNIHDLSKIISKQDFQRHFFCVKSDTTFMSKNGNKYFLTKELFPYSKVDTIEIRIFEFNNKTDLIKNNIRTLTENGELLESKGVIKVEFLIDSQKVETQEEFQVELKGNKYSNYNVYYNISENESEINWKKESELLVQIEYPNPDYDLINTIKEIPLDSLNYYEKLRDSIWKKYEFSESEKIKNKIVTVFSMNNNLLVNIDKLIETPLKKDFNIKCKSQDTYEDYMVYVIYENLNSFVSYYLTSSNLTIKQLPITGNAKGIIVTYAEDKILYDEFIINENSDSDININLKEIELEDFKEILTSN